MTGLLLVGGCVGHLEFDPRTDTGTGPKPINGNGGTGGAAVSPGGSGGSGGQAMPAPGTGGWTGTGGTAPTPDAGGGADLVQATGSGGSSGGYDDAGATTDGTVAAVACPTGYNVVTEVFGKKCSSCHSAASPTKNLDLATAGIGARMVNKLSTCMNQPLISGTLVGNTPTGLLFKKLAGKVDGCGGQMPAGAPALTAVEMVCVNEWAVAAINNAAGK